MILSIYQRSYVVVDTLTLITPNNFHFYSKKYKYSVRIPILLHKRPVPFLKITNRQVIRIHILIFEYFQTCKIVGLQELNQIWVPFDQCQLNHFTNCLRNNIKHQYMTYGILRRDTSRIVSKIHTVYTYECVYTVQYKQ